MTWTVIRLMLAAILMVAPLAWTRRAALYDAEHGAHRGFGLMVASWTLGAMLFFWVR